VVPTIAGRLTGPAGCSRAPGAPQTLVPRRRRPPTGEPGVGAWARYVGCRLWLGTSFLDFFGSGKTDTHDHGRDLSSVRAPG